MDNTKTIQFFEAAIKKTKLGLLSWNRVSDSTAVLIQLNRILDYWEIDAERSFMTKYNSGEIFLIRDSADDELCCLVKPDQNLAHQIVGDNNESSLHRLYNIVYSQFPSIDSFIDEFIQDH